MNNTTRAWKDPLFRARNSDVGLPASPVGAIELSDDVLDDLRGLATEAFGTMGCCGGITAYSWCGRTVNCHSCVTISYCNSYCGGAC